MNQDINNSFKKDIVQIMYDYVTNLDKLENENISAVDNEFVKTMENNTFHNAEHEELMLNIAKDILLSQDNPNGITVNDDTVIEGVCRVKTNKDMNKLIDRDYEKAKIYKSSLHDKTDSIKNKLTNIQSNLDAVEKLGLYLNLDNNEVTFELIVWYNH